MVSFVLYLLTAIATGGLNYYAMMAAVWGVPISGSQQLALGGSVLLLIAAYVYLIRPRVGRILAWLALAAIAIYYGPTTFDAFRGSYGRVDPLFIGLGLTTLLLHVTWLQVTYALFKEPSSTESVWIATAGDAAQKKIGIATALVVAAIMLIDVLFLGETTRRTYSMRWYEGKQSSEGERQVVLVFVDYPNYYQTLYSNALLDYLRSRGEPVVSVAFDIIENFHKTQSIAFPHIGDWRSDRDVRWESGHTCGSPDAPSDPPNFPPCPNNSSEFLPSPW